MKIISTKSVARMLQNANEAEELLQNTDDGFVQLEAPDSQTSAIAVSRLAEMSTMLSSSGAASATYRVELNIAGTPEGLSAAQEIMASLGRSAIEMPPAPAETGPGGELPTWVVPTAGGMALGFTGGLGLGMVVNAVRSSAAASGNPVMNGIAVGLGLLGTAVGGYIGASGARVSGVKFPGGELTLNHRAKEE